MYEKSILQATENFRITKNKYDNNLVTITDLLEADVSLLQAKLNLSLCLIDNSPTNILLFKLSEFISLPKVSYIYNNANIGFGAGHNIAIKFFLNVSKYHLVINPDISFENGVLETLFNFMEGNADVGHVMPKIIYPNGSVQYVAKLIPSPFDLIFKRFIPSVFIKKKLDRFQLKFTGYTKMMEVPYLSGCFMFLRVNTLKEVGLFDERFFMYPEDIDLTRRIHMKYKTIFYPQVEVVHAHEMASYKNLRMLIIHLKNMILYFNKWGWFFDNERIIINKQVIENIK